jgi:hypothetical protein
VEGGRGLGRIICRGGRLEIGGGRLKEKEEHIYEFNEVIDGRKEGRKRKRYVLGVCLPYFIIERYHMLCFVFGS